MKSIFITFDQIYYEQVQTILTLNHVRGFTGWESVIGRGSKTGRTALRNTCVAYYEYSPNYNCGR